MVSLGLVHRGEGLEVGAAFGGRQEGLHQPGLEGAPVEKTSYWWTFRSSVVKAAGPAIQPNFQPVSEQLAEAAKGQPAFAQHGMGRQGTGAARPSWTMGP